MPSPLEKMASPAAAQTVDVFWPNEQVTVLLETFAEWPTMAPMSVPKGDESATVNPAYENVAASVHTAPKTRHGVLSMIIEPADGALLVPAADGSDSP